MIEHSPEPLDSQTVAKSDSRVRRTRGWWWRLAKWGAIVGVLLLVLLVAGGVLAYAKRTTILNAILDATAPYRISAGRMEFDADGNLEFFDVQLNDDRAAGEGAAGNPTGTVITIPHASGLIDLRDALGGKIVSVTIDKPVIRIPLKSVMHGEAPAGLEAIEEKVSKIAPEFVSPRFALDRLVVNDAEMRVGDAISGRFDYDADALALYADGSIETRRHKLSVRDVRFHFHHIIHWNTFCNRNDYLDTRLSSFHNCIRSKSWWNKNDRHICTSSFHSVSNSIKHWTI